MNSNKRRERTKKYNRLLSEFKVRSIKKLENMIFENRLKLCNFKKNHILDSNPKHLFGNNVLSYSERTERIREIEEELMWSKELWKRARQGQNI